MEMETESGRWSSADSGLPGDPNGYQETEPAQTGEPGVDGALQGLAGLGDLPVCEHPAVYERIHGELAEVLSELRPGSGPKAEPGGDG